MPLVNSTRRNMTVDKPWRSPCWVSRKLPEKPLKPITLNADDHGLVVDEETQAKGAVDTPGP